ncbi:MAG TPA: cyclic nucleotide-binding domain-containing protein [Mariprofundaceae bacterium]|nr:cyclic nucleotide-binding domain-containing protein [Mariprofundaceae bacterium]
MSDIQLSSKARKALLDGDYKKALELFAQLHKAKPEDLRVHVRLAELYEKTGDTNRAIKHYIEIGNAYAEQGFVVQAIAVNKIILRLDPAQTEVKERLQDLSKERGDDWAVSAPSSMSTLDQAKMNVERTPLLSGLSGEELDAFIESLQLRHVMAGDHIYREGSRADCLYLIGMGSVVLRARDVHGKEQVFSHLAEGDFFGEHAFMSRREYADEAVAETDCSVLAMDRATFDAWVEKYPSIRSTVEDFYRERVLARVLAITAVFEGVPEEARMALADRFHLKTFNDGEEIVREGEPGDTFYLIRSGHVDVATSSMMSKGDQVELDRMGEGDFFGEVSLLTDKPRTATVRAHGLTELMELTRTDFDEIVRQYPSVRKVVETYQKQRVENTIKVLLERDKGARG